MVGPFDPPEVIGRWQGVVGRFHTKTHTPCGHRDRGQPYSPEPAVTWVRSYRPLWPGAIRLGPRSLPPTSEPIGPGRCSRSDDGRHGPGGRPRRRRRRSIADRGGESRPTRHIRSYRPPPGAWPTIAADRQDSPSTAWRRHAKSTVLAGQREVEHPLVVRLLEHQGDAKVQRDRQAQVRHENA